MSHKVRPIGISCTFLHKPITINRLQFCSSNLSAKTSVKIQNPLTPTKQTPSCDRVISTNLLKLNQVERKAPSQPGPLPLTSQRALLIEFDHLYWESFAVPSPNLRLVL